MRLEGLERHSQGQGPLHRLDARCKLIAAIVFVVIAVTTPVGAWTAFGAEGLVLAFVIGLAGIPPRELAWRWLGFFILVGFLAVVVAAGAPGAGTIRVGRRGIDHPDQEQPGAPDDAGSGGRDPVPQAAGGPAEAGCSALARRHAPVHGSLPLRAGRRARSHGDGAAGADVQPPSYPTLGPAFRLDRHAIPADIRTCRASSRRHGRSGLAGNSASP